MFRSRAGRRLVFVTAFCLAALDLLAGAAVAAGPSMTLSPKVGPPRSTVGLSATGFNPGESVDVLFDTATVASGRADGAGAVSGTSFQVPGSALPGTHRVKAVGRSSGLAAEQRFLVRTNWPQVRFSAAHSGFNPFENVLNRSNVSRLAVKWAVAPGGVSERSMSSSPAVANGRLYVASNAGQLYALDPSTGATLWSASGGGGTWNSSPVVGGGRVYVTSYGGTVHAFSAATGSSLWTVSTDGRYISSPTLADGRLYVASGGTAYAFDAATGATVWRARVSDREVGSTAPTVAAGRVHLNMDDRRLVTLDASTGAVLWSAPLHEYGAQGVPAVVNGVVYVTTASFRCRAYAFKASSGTLLWSVDTSVDIDPDWECEWFYPDSPSPAVANGVVYLSATGVWALDALTGATRWRRGKGASVSASPAAANGLLFFAQPGGGLSVLTAATGTLFAWVPGVGDEPWAGQPAVVDGHVYSTSANGTVYAFSLDGQ